MDKEQAIDLLDNLIGMIEDNQDNDYDAAFRMAIDALKAQLSQEGTTSDLISRQVAIDAIAQCTNCGDEDTLRGYVLKHNLDNGWTGGILEALDAVKDLPPVQPEPHEGTWVYGEDSTADCVDGYRCSQCGFFVPWDYNHKLIDYINDYAYCPHCGAKMINK